MLLDFLLNGVVTGSGYILVSLGMTLVFGVLDVVNVAHGMFYTMGAYACYSLSMMAGLGYLPSILLSMAVIAILGVIVERGIFKPLRTDGHISQIIAANGFGILMLDVIRLIWTADTRRLTTPLGTNMLNLGVTSLSYQRLLVIGLAVVVIVAVYIIIKRTWFGLMMRALPQDNMAAKLNGININVVSGITFAIGAAIAALAATVVAPIFTMSPTVGDVLGNKAFAIVILGGIGSVGGTVIASLLIGIIESLTAGYIATGYENLIAFSILVLTLIIKPTGIMGKRQK